MKKNQVVAVALAIGALIGTGKAQEQVIMTINSKPIKKSEFEAVYHKNNGKEVNNTTKSVKEYVDLFSLFKSKVFEAESMGLDTLTSFKTELAGYRRQLAAPYLTDKSTNENLLNEAYDRLKAEVLVAHILVRVDETALPKDTLECWTRINIIRNAVLGKFPTPAEIANYDKLLKNTAEVAKGLRGKDSTLYKVKINAVKNLAEYYKNSTDKFTGIAPRTSDDPSVVDNKGFLLYFSTFDMVYQFENVAFNTKVGEVSTVIRTRFGYHILKVYDRRASKGEISVEHIMAEIKKDATEQDKANEKGITDSAKVNNGKFAFNLKNTDPTMYWFTVVNDVNAQPNYIFFADASPVKASLIGDSLLYSSVEGGAAQRDYLEYRSMINVLVMQQQSMQADYTAASQAGDNTRMKAIQEEFQNLNNKYVSDMKNFVKTHPKSPMSAFIIGNDLNNDNIPIEQVIETLGYLDPSFANNKYVKAVNKKVEIIRGTMVGYKATNFSQNSPEGKPVKLSDFKGQYVLIDFWASWCRPCRMENPNVVSAYNRFKNKGFTVLGVSMDSNKDLWTAAIKADNLTWQHVSDLKGWGNEVGILYGVKGIPQNFLIDKEGKIVAKNLRGAELDEKLAEIIK